MFRSGFRRFDVLGVSGHPGGAGLVRLHPFALQLLLEDVEGHVERKWRLLSGMSPNRRLSGLCQGQLQ